MGFMGQDLQYSQFESPKLSPAEEPPDRAALFVHRGGCAKEKFPLGDAVGGKT